MAAAGFVCATLAMDGRRPPRRILHRPRYEGNGALLRRAGTRGCLDDVQYRIYAGQYQPLQCRSRAAMAHHAPHSASTDRGLRELPRYRRRRPGGGRPSGRQSGGRPMRSGPARSALTSHLSWRGWTTRSRPTSCSSTPRAATERPLRRSGQGLPFRKWMTSGHAAGWPTIEDYRCHLSTLFPPVRPRGWLELRVLDALPDWIRDVAVLTVAAACNTDASRELRPRMPDTSGLWVAAARDALNHPVLGEAARILFAVVADHLGSVTAEPPSRGIHRGVRHSLRAPRPDPGKPGCARASRLQRGPRPAGHGTLTTARSDSSRGALST